MARPEITITVLASATPSASSCWRTVARRRRPAIVVNSLGTPMMTRSLPNATSCSGSTLADHGHGNVISPVSSRIGLGAWHAICVAFGLYSAVAVSQFQNGFLLDELVPCWKLNAPGPSVVPAAKPSPSAPGHVCAALPVPVHCADTGSRAKSTNWCTTRSEPRTARDADANSLRAISNCCLPMRRVDSNMSSPGP